jgi:hypothetical protein
MTTEISSNETGNETSSGKAELERITRLCLAIVREDLSKSVQDKKGRQEKLDQLLHDWNR